MVPQALLLSRDPDVLRVMRRLLDDASVHPHVCYSTVQATAMLRKLKFDSVIVDCDDLDRAGEFLSSLRHAPSSRRAIAIALLGGPYTVPTAFRLGANFALDKPLSLELAARCLRAARGLILRECRRYHRHPVQLPVSLRVVPGDSLYAHGANFSEDGMAMEVTGRVPAGTGVKVRFLLPESACSVEANAQVAWQGREGMVGIRFVEMLEGSKYRYRRWLDQRLLVTPFPTAACRA
ncbi:MAG: PilZ domain-containing protein [Acidobacteria bacterium]|nr:PilZ domain-containing protein [Acidobacteriota bacterium]